MRDRHPPELPEVLTSSTEYSSLNESQKNSVSDRLQYYKEIVESSTEILSRDDGDLLDVIDNLDLDIRSAVGFSGDVEITVSTYIIHSSWSFECDKKIIEKLFTNDVEELIRDAITHVSSNYYEIRKWLYRWSVALSSRIKKIFQALDYSELIGNIILFDMLLTSFLLFSDLLRLRTEVR